MVTEEKLDVTAGISKKVTGWNCIENEHVCKFYIHGSVHRESNLITVQQDGTYSVYYISVGSSTCFMC